MRSVVIISFVLSVVLLGLSLLLYPYLESLIFAHYYTLINKSRFIVTSIDTRFMMNFKTSLSFGAMPLLTLLILVLVNKFKNVQVYTTRFYRYFLIILSAFLVGCFIKFLAIRMVLKTWDQDPLAAYVKNDVPVKELVFYQWGIYLSVGVCLFIFLFTNKVKK